MIQDLFGRCISLEGAETLSPEERSGKIITGEFLK